MAEAIAISGVISIIVSITTYYLAHRTLVVECARDAAKRSLVKRASYCMASVLGFVAACCEETAYYLSGMTRNLRPRTDLSVEFVLSKQIYSSDVGAELKKVKHIISNNKLLLKGQVKRKSLVIRHRVCRIEEGVDKLEIFMSLVPKYAYKYPNRLSAEDIHDIQKEQSSLVSIKKYVNRSRQGM